MTYQLGIPLVATLSTQSPFAIWHRADKSVRGERLRFLRGLDSQKRQSFPVNNGLTYFISCFIARTFRMQRYEKDIIQTNNLEKNDIIQRNNSSKGDKIQRNNHIISFPQNFL